MEAALQLESPAVEARERLAGFVLEVAERLPLRRNSVVGSVALEAIGKAAGTNTMMRELGGVFGIAISVAVFAAAGSYASALAFTDGFTPAIGVAAGLALCGAIAGTALPGRRRAPEIRPTDPTPAFEAEGRS